MRTLKEIDEQIAADTAQVVDENISLLISESDARWLQSELRFGEKYREMYGILEDIEDYFRCLDAGELKDASIMREKIEGALKKL